LTKVGKYATITTKVYFTRSAFSEFKDLSRKVMLKFEDCMKVLELKGKLTFPEGKKLHGTKIWEMRVKERGEWRGLYSYVRRNEILLLRFFRKKIQKTPIREIKLAKHRLKYY
jgi:phage-related protein